MLPAGVRLYHVRHGQTDWNREGRLQGQTDIPLNATGRDQAARNGAALAEHFRTRGIAPETLRYVASPLGRTQATMAILREAMGLPAAGFETEAALLEVAFGEWAGFTTSEIKASGQRALVNARRADKWGFVPPGGESYAQLAERVRPWLATITEDCLVVSHGGVFRALCWLICRMSTDEAPRIDVPQDKAALFQDGTLRYI